MNKLLILALLALGCAAEDDEETSFPKNPCVTSGSSYLVSYDEMSGDCGPISDEVLYAKDILTIDADCNHGPAYDGCTTVLDDLTCSVSGSDPYTIQENGTVTFAEDGSSGSGTVSVHISAPGYLPCSSVYSITITRL